MTSFLNFQSSGFLEGYVLRQLETSNVKLFSAKCKHGMLVWEEGKRGKGGVLEGNVTDTFKP